MDNGEAYEFGASIHLLLEGLQNAIELVRACGWGVVFENERFRSWLPLKRRELENQGVVALRRFERLTKLMLDFVDFAKSTMSQDIAHVVMMLNDIYTAFDRIAEVYTGASESR